MTNIILGSIAEKLLAYGFEKLQNSVEFQNTKNAVYESIIRELRFNLELIQDVQKNTVKTSSEDLCRSISQEMEFSAFQRLEETFIPLKLFFEGTVTPKVTKNKSYKNWSSQFTTEFIWIERTYHRLRILRCRWRSGKFPNKQSLGYVEWLIKSICNQNQ